VNELVHAALNRIPADTWITDVRLANVITGEIYPADIVIHRGKVVAVEPPGTQPQRQARQRIHGQGRLAVPGLVDSHLHIESSLVTPAHFAAAVLPRGVTTVAEDPHEIANVLGPTGIRAMIQASAGIPLKVLFLVSSSVPSAAGLETPGGAITPADVRELLALPQVIGLAEVMDGAGLLADDPNALGVLEAAGGLHGYRMDSPGVIEGHNPMLRGRALSAFVAAGVDSDHTQATPPELVEKARLGVTLQLQERYLTRELIQAVMDLPFDTGVCLVTDDVAPDYLLEVGHLDQVLRRAIALGMDPLYALRAATLNPARRLRLWDRGAIAPGRAADIVLVESIEEFQAQLVMVDGQIVAQDGRSLWQPPAQEPLARWTQTVHLPPQRPEDFHLAAPVQEGQIRVRTIDCVPGQTRVTPGQATLPVRAGRIQLPPGEDLVAIAVVERHGRHGGRSFGLIRGLGVERGGLATTYAHDSHNLAIMGRTPEEMARAANAVIAMQGGIAVVEGERVLAQLPLPIAGILSDRPVAETAQALKRVGQALRALGLEHPHWLMRISTFTLPVSSGLRITDLGLVDAQARQLVDLFVA